jgi:hypothetical protein
MRVVTTYARFCSGKKESSIDQQYDNCERFAEREAWAITQRYEDLGVSGSKVQKGGPAISRCSVMRRRNCSMCC